MRALVQRVLNASVDAEVDGTTIRAGDFWFFSASLTPIQKSLQKRWLKKFGIFALWKMKTV
jgi:hypothetical protein